MANHTKEDVTRVVGYALAPGMKLVTAEMAHMLTAYAERIEADERAVPVAWISHFHIVGLPEKDYYGKLPIQRLQPGVYSHTPLFTQPAQSVDVEKVREVIADLREYGDEALADKLAAALQEKGNG